jgi:hypothetical protein
MAPVTSLTASCWLDITEDFAMMNDNVLIPTPKLKEAEAHKTTPTKTSLGSIIVCRISIAGIAEYTSDIWRISC